MTTETLPIAESDLIEIMIEVTTVVTSEQGCPPPGEALADLATEIAISGDTNFLLSIRAPVCVAAHLATYWLAIPAAETSPQDAADAMSELANVVAGMIKPILGQEYSLGLPSIVGLDRFDGTSGAAIEADVPLAAGVLRTKLAVVD